MPDPVTTQYLGLPGYLFLWILTVAAFVLFGRQVYLYVRVLRTARGEKRWGRIPKRIAIFAANVLGQKRMFEEPAIGIAHFVIFWSFVFYAGSFLWNLTRGLFPFLPIPYADEVGWVALIVQVFGVLGLVGVLVAAVRRYAVPPPRLEKSRDAGIILLLIALVLVSSLAGRQAARAQMPSLYLAMWWTHMATVLGFLAYLPYSKHLHLLASPFGVFFASTLPGYMPAPSEGASQLKEFTWRQLFGGLACAECGRCDRACPALSSGYPLSPKQVMHELKVLIHSGLSQSTDNRPLVGNGVKSDEIWACVTCAACMERCPVLNEHLPVLIEARRYLVARGELDGHIQTALVKLTRYGNSFGQSPRSRAKWTQGLEFKIKDARKEPVEYLWFVGDYASFDPRLQEMTRAAARVFWRAGLDFGILYEAENNSGNDVRRVGEEGLFDTLAEKNLAALVQAHFRYIVTTDPHSYHALKNEYGKTGNGRVLHYTELLDRLAATGKLSPAKQSGLTLTYHDPCYLGRYNGVYEPARRILRDLGARLVEMPRNRGHAFCCGAGGGRIWAEDPPGIRERPAENRVREAAGLPGVGTLVVSCPKDFVMFQDALKTTGLEGRITVTDVAQLVEMATRAA